MSWKVVSTKKNKKVKPNKSNINVKLSKGDVLDGMMSVFSKYRNITKGVFLYGSTSRETNTDMSDIDVLVIWNKYVPIDLATQLREELAKTFLKKVDLVCMVYRNKMFYDFDNISTQNEVFLENVHRDAIPIFGDKEDIRFSENFGKF